MSTAPSSKYALKRRGAGPVAESNTKSRRVCDKCKHPLRGKRGHGFPSRDGQAILCGGCGGRP